jgi:leucyl aminopeptidase
LNKLIFIQKDIQPDEVKEFTNVCKAVYLTRDLVNEPLNNLSAVQLSDQFKELGKSAGFSVEVFNKKKIESLKMGGLLGVNMGSVDPPTFTILEYKPSKAINKNPYILVGKGVVYDTGGLSLKDSDGMSIMKCDMAGAAAVAGAMYAIAKNKLPIYIIGLIPATDNRPGGNAMAPGDVITISNGKTVEVLNTDAEGRLILADALSFATKYKPELVIDLATLTGAAARAIGKEGIVFMGNAKEKFKERLKKSGQEVFERLVEFPLWEEYQNYLKSDIADLKNIGPSEAGAITAGKFLENFVDYDWLHLDIAGSAFLGSPDFYRTKNATGVGVRLLYNFFKSIK